MMKKIVSYGYPIFMVALFAFVIFTQSTTVRAVTNANTNRVVVNLNTNSSTNSEVRALDSTVNANTNVSDDTNAVVDENANINEDINVNADDPNVNVDETVPLDDTSANGTPDTFTISKTTAYIAGAADVIIILILLILALHRRGPKM